MRRYAEFKAFLNKNNKSEDYIGYCENIEKAFGGKDMDDIICSHQNISKVHTKLEAIFPKKHSVANYMSGLNRYLEFSVSGATSAVTGAPAASVSSLYHVARGKGIALSPEVAFVSQTLEQEYASIVQFAKEVLVEGSFGYIPVIISDETPVHDSPDGDGKVLGAFFPSEKPHIEIYYRNGDPYDPAQFRKCLAHEYLHYLHFAFSGTEFDNAKKELKEALADFFGVLYSIHRHGKDDLVVAKARYDRWKKNFGTCWPYANALHFYRAYGGEKEYSSDYTTYQINGSIGKFVQVFFGTKQPDEAYNALIG